MPLPSDDALRGSPIPGITRNVFLLGLVSLATDASTEMIYPLIPLFLAQTLRAPVTVIGVIEGLAEATASLFKGLSGWVSDRVGRRKPLVIGGYGLAALTKPLLALAGGWPLVLVARVLDRLGKGLRGAPRDALIADSSPGELRGRAFGFHRSADQTGAVLGPLLALPLLAAFQHDYRALFVAAFVPAALGVALLGAVSDTGRTAASAPGRAGPLRLAEIPLFRRFLFIMLLFALGNSSDVFLFLRAQHLGYGVSRIVLLFVAFNLVYVASAYPAGQLSDRLGRRRVLAAGLGLFAMAYGGFAAAPEARWLWLLFPLYGLYMGLTDGVSRAFVVDLAPAEQRATALGVYSMAVGLTAFVASSVAGWLWQRFGAPAPFWMGATLAAGAALLVALTPDPRPARAPAR
ncbi:MAG: MFS transporter [Acidobacteria bacterium]|nr:MFS transporter [Acidobacteriota bacterium]